MRALKLVLSVFLCFLTGLANSQAVKSADTTKHKDKYLTFGVGQGFGNFKDKALGPVRYGGVSLKVALGRLMQQDRREVAYQLDYVKSYYSAIRSAEDYLTNLSQIGIEMQMLWSLRRSPIRKLRCSMGSSVDGNLFIRVNEALSNASFGLDGFLTWFAAGRLSYDFTWRQKARKVLFVKFKEKARHYKINYTLHVPVLPFSFRPDFSYVGNFVAQDESIFSNRQLLLQGFRLKALLEITKSMVNGNAWKLGYEWDMMQGGERKNRLEIGQHHINFTLHFKIN